jgi:transposase
MLKYDENFKRAIVLEYLSGSGGFRALASKYGLDRATLRFWVDRYRHHGEAGLRKKLARYSAQFKLSVLKRMWAEQLGYRQVIALFDLRVSTAVVSGWERRYHEGAQEALKPKQPVERPKRMKVSESAHSSLPAQSEERRTLEELRQENEYLRAEVAYLKKLDALVRAQKSATPPKRKP